ncbi:MAG TPA: long-chain fatty acid--CoA ligase [Anaeromyxobacter sp.]|nr:long-chain fatty acid--CoA ligase [Anaeromyxobacter sp.]
MPDENSKTVPDLFLERVGRTPDDEAFRYPEDGRWVSLSWAEMEARVRAVAGGLHALGVAPEQVCAILSATRIEWVLADYGVLCAGGATSAIYPSSTAEECAFILSDSGAVVAFVDGAEQVAKLASRRAELPALKHVVTFDGAASQDGWVMPFAELVERGRAHDRAHPGSFEETAAAVRPEATATLLYTSGTTGRPKGVELTHHAWVSQSRAVEISGILDHPGAFQFFWLPLAHSFGKMVGTAQLRLGFPTAVDGRIDRIVENLARLRPTFVCAVPRIFEKVHAKILSGVREGGPVKAALFRWALEAGREARRVEREGRRPGPVLAARRALADRLVFQRIRALFGGRLQFFVSGSAPLSPEVAGFFDAMGVAILEGYGLTETSAATHCNRLDAWRVGTVGLPLPGMEARVAEDGEVLVRGPWVMRGYHGLPDQTAEAIDADGWLHTGDVGTMDAQGFLTITDRKKDLIKTSGGKYVAPAELEARIKLACPLASQVLVHGDRRNFVSALVTLDPEAALSWAAGNGLEERDPAALSRLPELHAVLQRGIDRVNAALPRFAAVRKFTVLPAEFTEAAGEVTPSQKLKRRSIEGRYRAELDAMYGEARPPA